MSDYRVKGTDLASVADAIRTAGETSAPLTFPAGFVEAIGNISGGGGGAKNLATGTFTGETTGAAMDVSIPYTGDGFPIAGVIFPTSGGNAGDIASLAQMYVTFLYAFVKKDTSTTPTYDADTSANQATVTSLYKYSDSDPASSTASRELNNMIYRNNNAGATPTFCVRFKDAVTMSIYIASTSYGFPDNIEFGYLILYSE